MLIEKLLVYFQFQRAVWKQPGYHLISVIRADPLGSLVSEVILKSCSFPLSTLLGPGSSTSPPIPCLCYWLFRGQWLTTVTFSGRPPMHLIETGFLHLSTKLQLPTTFHSFKSWWLDKPLHNFGVTRYTPHWYLGITPTFQSSPFALWVASFEKYLTEITFLYLLVHPNGYLIGWDNPRLIPNLNFVDVSIWNWTTRRLGVALLQSH